MPDTDEKLPTYRLVSAEQIQQYRRIPALAVHWCHDDNVVLIGGGGGTKGTGVPSGIVVNTVSSVGILTPVAFLDTNDKLVAAIAAHPNDPILACAVAEFVYIVRRENTTLNVLQFFKADFSEDSPFLACLKFDPSGSILACGGQDSLARTFSYPSFTKQNQFKHHQNCIQTISFNRTSKLLAVSSKETFFSVWQVDHSKMFTLSFRKMEIRGCMFCSHNDNILFAWMNDRQIGGHLAKWDVVAGKILKFVQLDEKPATSATLSADGSAIAITTMKRGCTVYTFDTRTLSLVGKKVLSHDFPQTSMSFSPIGDRLVSVSADMSAFVFRARSSSGLFRNILFLFFIAGLVSSLLWSGLVTNLNVLNPNHWKLENLRNIHSAHQDHQSSVENSVPYFNEEIRYQATNSESQENVVSVQEDIHDNVQRQHAPLQLHYQKNSPYEFPENLRSIPSTEQDHESFLSSVPHSDQFQSTEKRSQGFDEKPKLTNDVETAIDSPNSDEQSIEGELPLRSDGAVDSSIKSFDLTETHSQANSEMQAGHQSVSNDEGPKPAINVEKTIDSPQSGERDIHEVDEDPKPATDVETAIDSPNSVEQSIEGELPLRSDGAVDSSMKLSHLTETHSQEANSETQTGHQSVSNDEGPKPAINVEKTIDSPKSGERDIQEVGEEPKPATDVETAIDSPNSDEQSIEGELPLRSDATVNSSMKSFDLTETHSQETISETQAEHQFVSNDEGPKPAINVQKTIDSRKSDERYIQGFELPSKADGNVDPSNPPSPTFSNPDSNPSHHDLNSAISVKDVQEHAPPPIQDKENSSYDVQGLNSENGVAEDIEQDSKSSVLQVNLLSGSNIDSENVRPNMQSEAVYEGLPNSDSVFKDNDIRLEFLNSQTAQGLEDDTDASAEFAKGIADRTDIELSVKDAESRESVSPVRHDDEASESPIINNPFVDSSALPPPTFKKEISPDS